MKSYFDFHPSCFKNVAFSCAVSSVYNYVIYSNQMHFIKTVFKETLVYFLKDHNVRVLRVEIHIHIYRLI